MGFASAETQPLHCMADASGLPALSEGFVSTKPTLNVAALVPAKFNTQQITGALNDTLNKKPVSCVVCHAPRTEVVSFLCTNIFLVRQTNFKGFLRKIWLRFRFAQNIACE